MQSIQKIRRNETATVEYSNIIRIEAKNSYCKIYFTDQRSVLVVSKVLHLVQANLPADMFVRVHPSHLVNRLFIKSVSGTHTKTVELTNGEFVAVSRRRHAVFLPVKSA